MAAVKAGFRTAMTWLHDWAGLVLGWLLFAIALAGSLSVFRQEIGNWARPEAAAGPYDTAMSGEAAVRWLAANAPGSSGWYVQPADARGNATLAIWSTPKGFEQHWVDPRTGAAGAIRETLGGDFFYRLHFELQLPFPWGRIIAGSAAMLLVLTIVSGIIAHRRFFADFFTFRPGKGQRSWLDAHNLLGVTALPFHLMIAFTGALTLANLIMPWAANSLYRGDTAAQFAELYPSTFNRPVAGRPAALAPIAQMLRTAKQRLGTDIAQINVANPGDAAAVVTVVAAEDARIGVSRAAINFDGPSGRILSVHDERRPAMRTFDFLYGLHTARFGEWLTRWLYFLSGLGLTAVIATGLLLWTAKRRVHRQGLGFAIVERLNIGFVAGTPIAFAAFFLANRLLPVGLAGRQDMEVRTLFWCWGAVLLFAAIRTPARAWRDLLWTAAAACAGIMAIDLFTDGRLADRLPLDLTALAMAAGFAVAARRASR